MPTPRRPRRRRRTSRGCWCRTRSAPGGLLPPGAARGRAGRVPDLNSLEAGLRAPQPDHLEAPVVLRRLLPAGWAVRQHVLRADGPDGGAVQESVAWTVLLPGVDDALLRLTPTWHALVLGERLGEQADRLAAGLAVTIRSS